MGQQDFGLAVSTKTLEKMFQLPGLLDFNPSFVMFRGIIFVEALCRGYVSLLMY